MLGNSNAKEVYKDWTGLIKDGNVPNTWDDYLKVYVTEKELVNRQLIYSIED